MTGENPTAVKVFTWLLKQMDKRNALVISQQALAEALGVSRMTIHTSTKYLKEKKAIDVFKSGNVSIYAVNAQIAWKADANGKKYALFDAAVYIAESEQDKPLFDTQLVGHAKPRPAKKRNKILAETEAGSAEEQPVRDRLIHVQPYAGRPSLRSHPLRWPLRGAGAF